MSLEDKCLNNYNDNDLPTTTWQDIITEKWSQTLFCVLSYRSSHYCLIVAPKMFNPLLISQNTNWITNSSRPKAGIKTHIKAFKWSFRLWPKTPTDVFFFCNFRTTVSARGKHGLSLQTVTQKLQRTTSDSDDLSYSSSSSSVKHTPANDVDALKDEDHASFYGPS